MDYEQLSFLELDSIADFDKKDTHQCKRKEEIEHVESEEICIMDLPFLGCDFEKVYPIIKDCLPQENISFLSFGVEKAIVCEIINTAICHQINWDFLRLQIYEKTQKCSDWLTVAHLKKIQENEVDAMLHDYDKPLRLRIKERTVMLREIGNWLEGFRDVFKVFFDDSGVLLRYQIIHKNLSRCLVFAKDPQEKKLQLLLQKLSAIDMFKGITVYCRPAVDYHLIRMYSRRGLIYTKTKQAHRYWEDDSVAHYEKTMAKIRKPCAELMSKLCELTNLDIVSINQIEWNIGRSVCVKGEPDCMLKKKDSEWLKNKFSTCPFFDTCVARCDKRSYLAINEPHYKGSSY